MFCHNHHKDITKIKIKLKNQTKKSNAEKNKQKRKIKEKTNGKIPFIFFIFIKDLMLQPMF